VEEDFIVHKVKILIFICLGILLLLSFSLIAQFDDDLEDLEEMEEIEGGCIPENLATCYDSLADNQYSEDEIKKWISLGHEHFKHGDYKAALPYLWKVFEVNPGKYGKVAVRELAESYYNLEIADTTLIVCYKGLKIFPDHPTLHYYAGSLQEKAGRITCAIPHFEELTKSQPENKQYLEMFAFLLFKNKDERAIEIQQKVVNLYPEDNDARIKLSRYISFFGGDAWKQLIEAWKNDPQNINLAISAAEATIDAGEYKIALEPLNSVIKSKSEKKATAYKLRAQCYESLDQFINAINDYKRLLEINPSDAESMCAIADDYRNLNQFKNGVYWVQRALKTISGFGLAYITMGDIYSSAVSYCQNSANRSRSYDDALIYKLAYDEYAKALRDFNYKSTAGRRMKSLMSFIPSEEEKFMNQNRNYLKDACYTSWISEKVNL
jgi:tetratricopeptide (TPR) repeat protein